MTSQRGLCAADNLTSRHECREPAWGAPRIHGELLKLGIDVGQTTVAKYMARRRQQSWKTFLRNHADGIASMDLFVVPTISFRLLYGFLIFQHSRRQLLWLGVTARPSAHWIARTYARGSRSLPARGRPIERRGPSRPNAIVSAIDGRTKLD